MIVTEVNPPWLAMDRYVEFLNHGFSGQWDRRGFEWYLRRLTNGRPADITVRSDGTQILAGVTACYRQLRHGSDQPLDVAVLSAGTTLPGERGRGHYRTILQASIDLCRQHSCAAVLGFVTRDNASGRGLLRLGARAIPSYYISNRAMRAGPSVPKRCPTWIDPSTMPHSTHSPQLGDVVRFHYAHARDWHGQFVGRPRPVAGLRMGHDSFALVERVGRTDRLQWLGTPAHKMIGAIATAASASVRVGRDFFTYTLDPLLASAASRQGLRVRRGFLMMLPLDSRASLLECLPDAAWQVQSGDRL